MGLSRSIDDGISHGQMRFQACFGRQNGKRDPGALHDPGKQKHETEIGLPRPLCAGVSGCAPPATPCCEGCRMQRQHGDEQGNEFRHTATINAPAGTSEGPGWRYVCLPAPAIAFSGRPLAAPSVDPSGSFESAGCRNRRPGSDLRLRRCEKMAHARPSLAESGL